MASTIAWLDYSEAERRRMREIVNLFREQGILDELGLGTIRDALSDLFFPGTSTIQSRARYFLFIPWLYRRIERQQVPSAQVAARARSDEIRLMDALVKGGETSDVIGIQSRERLRTLPSAIYWHGLWVLGIRKFPGTIAQYHRSLDGGYAALRHLPRSEEGEAASASVPPNWHGGLPCAPEKWLKSTTFALTSEEASYLKDRIVTQCPDSLFAFLVRDGRDVAGAHGPWELPATGMPEHLVDEIGHAERFSLVMHGATICYHALLSRLTGQSEAEEKHRDTLEQWANAMAGREDDIARWDRTRFWDLINRLNRRVPLSTRAFVEEWIALASSDPHRVLAEPRTAELLSAREWRIKGRLARLSNPRARENWRGPPSIRPLTFRWRDGVRVITDVADGLRHA